MQYHALIFTPSSAKRETRMASPLVKRLTNYKHRFSDHDHEIELEDPGVSSNQLRNSYLSSSPNPDRDSRSFWDADEEISLITADEGKIDRWMISQVSNSKMIASYLKLLVTNSV